MPTNHEIIADYCARVREHMPELFTAPAMHAFQASHIAPSAFDVKCDRLLYLIATGYEDAAEALARELATEAYDDYLDRCRCEVTGNVYFHVADWSAL